MTTPLYSGIGNPQNTRSHNYHKGLWFERFFNCYDNNWEVVETVKQDWIGTVAGKCGDEQTLSTKAMSQRQLCEDLSGTSLILKNDWHFVTGMGNNHPVENGFSWHPTLGTPYLSGASIKGLIRAWIEQWDSLEEQDLEEKSLRWFGSKDKSDNENQAGAFIFFDALPVTSTKLSCDIMTPHMGEWYAKGENISKKDYANTLPADWHNPNLIPFLVVKQASFQFSIAPRPYADIKEGELEEVIEVLQLALEYLGVGSKTATGYGRFSEDKESSKKIQKIQIEARRKNMKPEDRFADELQAIEDKKLAEMFGKGFNKTKKQYEAEGCNWEEILKILLENKDDIIKSWSTATKNTAEAKAFKKLKIYLEF